MELQELSDRAEIRELLYNYGRIPDMREFDLVDDVFSEDAELIAPYFSKPVLKGREEIRREMIQGIDIFEDTMHAVHNNSVKINGDQADGLVNCIALHILMKEGKKMKADLGIRYADKYVRTSDGWRIARRELHELWQHIYELNETFV